MNSKGKAPNGMDRPTVKLVGQDGNAFMVMGLCQRALKGAKFPEADIAAFYEQCQSGDYNHLLQTAMSWCDVR